MSTHPNVILMAVLTPNNLSRKTMRDILGDNETVKIGEKEYHPTVMEDDYDEGNQISAKEGDLVFHNLITYGYGESISWNDLEQLKTELEKLVRQLLFQVGGGNYGT